jgi:spore coat polysaccharide biosynthesis predicted glycosyltransferase SpsG
VAVIGAGTTMWEAAFLGVPSISVIVADNQAAPAFAAADIGFTVAVDARAGASPATIEHATRELLADGARRDRMTQIGRSEVDGMGATRVAAFLSEFTVDGGRTPC